MVLDDERAVEAERLGLDVVFNEIAEPLAAVELGATAPRDALPNRPNCIASPSGVESQGVGTTGDQGRFQPSQSQIASPITSSRSRPWSQGSSSVNMVTHSRYEQGMRVISVPQKQRCGPNVSMIWRR